MGSQGATAPVVRTPRPAPAAVLLTPAAPSRRQGWHDEAEELEAGGHAAPSRLADADHVAAAAYDDLCDDDEPPLAPQ